MKNNYSGPINTEMSMPVHDIPELESIVMELQTAIEDAKRNDASIGVICQRLKQDKSDIMSEKRDENFNDFTNSMWTHIAKLKEVNNSLQEKIKKLQLIVG